MSWVIENSRHKGSSFVVLLMIANYAHKDGSNAFPGFETIARDSRISVRQVTRIIPVLERSRELVVEHGKGPHGTNRYTVNMRQTYFSMDKMSNGQTESRNVQQSVRNQVLEPSPLPPASGGEETFRWGFEQIAVQMGRRHRLPNLGSYQGAQAKYVVDFLRQRGFEARVCEAA